MGKDCCDVHTNFEGIVIKRGCDIELTKSQDSGSKNQQE